MRYARGATVVGIAVLVLAAMRIGTRDGVGWGFTPAGGKAKARRIVLATVPRSGNGWIRGCLEGATGQATHSVFPETLGDVHAEWDGDTLAYGSQCGWLQDCEMVGSVATGRPFVVKTHFPFTSNGNGSHRATEAWIAESVRSGRSDVSGEVDYIILQVRNPMDNYDAWLRYNERKHIQLFEYASVREYVAAWVRHMEFWLAQPGPKAVYQYELLVDRPALTLRKVLAASGMTESFGLTDMSLLQVAAIPKLRPYKRKQTGATTRTKDNPMHTFLRYDAKDIEWVLQHHRSTLARCSRAPHARDITTSQLTARAGLATTTCTRRGSRSRRKTPRGWRWARASFSRR